jgi:hypothetical protein
MKVLDPPLEDEELVLVVVLLDESWVDVTVDWVVDDVVVVLLELLVVDDEELEVLLLVELVELDKLDELLVDVEVEDGEYTKVVVCTAVLPRPPHVAFTR